MRPPPGVSGEIACVACDDGWPCNAADHFCAPQSTQVDTIAVMSSSGKRAWSTWCPLKKNIKRNRVEKVSLGSRYSKIVPYHSSGLCTLARTLTPPHCRILAWLLLNNAVLGRLELGCCKCLGVDDEAVIFLCLFCQLRLSIDGDGVSDD